MNDKFQVDDGELARQMGLRCMDCNSKNLVYAISKSLGIALPAGAYCYKCLRTRCKATRCIPYPIPADLLEKLKHDMGLSPLAVPLRFKVGG